MNVNIGKVERWVHSVDINFWNCWYVLYYVTKEITGFSRRKWPPSGTLRLFQKCANFPLLTLPSLLLLLPEKGRAIWRHFLLLAFSESRELVHTYTFHRKGPVRRTLLYPGFLIPLAVLTSRERWGRFQPPACVCK